MEMAPDVLDIAQKLMNSSVLGRLDIARASIKDVRLYLIKHYQLNLPTLLKAMDME